ncbi:helix-turn-helix transcriptional regulator [Niveispirillum irakense]|uniref:helix-turn-helix transcriptional regulator n=1 Tax=Niveispirillum irakense TaxID=34011 RepID=UPI00041E3ACE|nr:helix-turn-helix transcriptional regulator [Niveispirillum irakense]
MADTSLGTYLRDKRARLDPAALGYGSGRRRTPGLRREEVAQRAHISPTWYSWLEQGRGGAPSAEVLDRIARALMLTDVERDHLFLLGLGRLPDVRYRPSGDVSPRLQRVLDAMETSPALVRTVRWDVVAWNRAAALMLCDYGLLPPQERNILRLVFLDPRSRAHNQDWEAVARFVVGAFRADIARAGAQEELAPFVQEMCSRSADFTRLWQNGDVHGFGEGVKHLRHPVLGAIAIEYSAFTVDGRPDLTLLIYNPMSREDADRIRSLLPLPLP